MVSLPDWSSQGYDASDEDAGQYEVIGSLGATDVANRRASGACALGLAQP